MMQKGRIAAALFVSTLAHGAVLVSITGQPIFQPEPVQAGRLSVSLQESGAEGRTNDESNPAETQDVKAPKTADAADRQIATKADSRSASSQADEQQPVSKRQPLAESSPATATNSAVRPEAKAGPTPSISAKSPGEPARRSHGTKQAHVHRDEPATHSLASETAETKAPPTVSADNSAAPAATPGARRAVRAHLENELAKHFHYPFLARRRGWEGKVLLRLRIDGRGQIDSTEIAQSSGHSVLDRAALDAVARVARIPGAAERLGGIGFDLELPVIYRLREG